MLCCACGILETRVLQNFCLWYWSKFSLDTAFGILQFGVCFCLKYEIVKLPVDVWFCSCVLQSYVFYSV